MIAGTFAKYTTKAEGSDTARVATWGFADSSSITLTNLFKNAYDKNVQGTADVIAPGTTNSADFAFKYSGQETAPEVAYTFKVDTDGSSCADNIKNNKNIQWKLDEGNWGTWDQLIVAIEAMDGNVVAGQDNATPADYHAAGTLPTGFDKTTTHKVSWQWIYNTDDQGDTTDTAMGNATKLDNVTLKITVTATQID